MANTKDNNIVEDEKKIKSVIARLDKRTCHFSKSNLCKNPPTTFSVSNKNKNCYYYLCSYHYQINRGFLEQSGRFTIEKWVSEEELENGKESR